MASTQRLHKAVIPAAGLGTRFLPATKSVPKEMLPVVDRPAIQYVIEEAVAAGIDDILIITSPTKRPIEDHFDRNVELEMTLESRNKLDELAEIRALPALAHIHYTRQGQPLGLGHAIGMAANHVGSEPFAVLLPDDLIVDEGRLLSRMIDLHSETGSAVVAAMDFPPEEVVSYGVFDPESVNGDVVTVKGMVEKPALADIPSTYGAIGRYVFPGSIFAEIAATKPGVGGEIQLTDAIAALIDKEGVLAVVSESERYDAGQKLDWLRATVELALQHPELGEPFGVMLQEVLAQRGLTS